MISKVSGCLASAVGLYCNGSTMCGIAGEIRFDQQKVDLEPLYQAIDHLKVRGPDDNGTLSQDHWSFGHTRLSIIDLSSQGHQPMSLSTMGIDLVYNGEIYNYQDIKLKLQDLGYSFQTHSDTEVLATAYRQWGLDFVQKLNGMFAFVLFDHKNKKFLLGRDRMGIKPLYYFKNNKRLCFASNVKALLSFVDKDVDLSIDPEALQYYMSLHAIVPEPKTIFRGVQKLPAAHLMELHSKGSFNLLKYWEPDYGEDPTFNGYNEEDWLQSTEGLIKKSVKRRMVADVPVGLFLSGGVDSSLLAALMCETSPNKINTFSIGFSGVGGEEGNEFQYSDLVAQKYSTDHHKIEVTSQDILDHLADCVGSMNEPMVSYDNIGFYLLAKYSTQFTKVVQSGQGADEIFAGYHWHYDLRNSKNVSQDYRSLFLDRDYSELKEVLHPEWCSQDYTGLWLDQYFEKNNALEPLTQVLKLDSHIMLVEDPVKRVDSHTMRWGLEARVPFLDHELVEWAAKIPPHLKVNDEPKYLLKKIASRYIPDKVLYRPKGYFPVPELKNLTGPFKSFVLDYVQSDRFRQRGIFNLDYVSSISKNPEQHITKLRGNKLWQVVSLEIWLQELGL